jgi:type IV fimbrial biogenesis protein FimT
MPSPKELPMNSAPIRRQRGVTLTESTIVVAIAAILLGLAAPGFEQMRERRHLEGIAAQLETDLQFTRGLAVAQNQVLRLAFASTTCYVVHAGAAADCQCVADGSASCAGEARVLRVVQLDPEAGVVLHSNSVSIGFDPVKGTVTPTATMQVVARSGSTIRKIVNVMGRVRSCSPAPALAGYTSC